MTAVKLDNFVHSSRKDGTCSRFLLEKEVNGVDDSCSQNSCFQKDLSNFSSSCDACPYCDDCCEDEFCRRCRPNDVISDEEMCPTEGRIKYYTYCQVRRHNHEESAWLIVDGGVYDATSVLSWHPGGAKSILRNSGGTKNCIDDMNFHSKKAVKFWKSLKIGELRNCVGASVSHASYSDDQCTIC